MVDTPEKVDQLTEQMRNAGARVTKEPVDAEFFTGRSARKATTSKSLGLSRITQSRHAGVNRCRNRGPSGRSGFACTGPLSRPEIAARESSTSRWPSAFGAAFAGGIPAPAR